tara:strand:+ start:170 stop:349 length:180 start_codon:yes stop_codon:yes gene_type:complete
MDQPMSYLLFKLTLEMAHLPTYGNDERVQQLYQEYLQNYNTQKKSGEIIPASVIKFCKK